MEKSWTELTPDEKRAARFKKWLEAPGVKFNSQKAENAYRLRVQRFIDAVNLKEPDRVPVILPAGFFPAFYSGGSLEKSMYDYQELAHSWKLYVRDFDMDNFAGPGLVLPAPVLEMIGHNLHKWPGHGLPSDSALYQFIEGEYMKAEDYTTLNLDPTDFWLRTFLPRVAKVFEPFRSLTPLNAMVGIPMGYIAAYNNPDLQQAYKTLFAAAKELSKWQKVVRNVSDHALRSGLPSFSGAMSGAPFDMIADMHRGTQGSILDMYRRPEVLNEALEKIAAIAIKQTLANANLSLCPIMQMPLHKGDDSFMSDKQFEKFYWPTFRKLMMAMINEGLVPMPFAEGGYSRRLEYIKDMPRGSVIWWFERMDMARAKQVMGKVACIAGNIPVSVLCTGTPAEVKENCRNLIETAGKGGGYILAGAASMNKGNPENLRVIMQAAKEYGTYRK